VAQQQYHRNQIEYAHEFAGGGRDELKRKVENNDTSFRYAAWATTVYWQLIVSLLRIAVKPIIFDALYHREIVTGIGGMVW